MELKSTFAVTVTNESTDPDSETERASNPGSGKATPVTVTKLKKKEVELSAVSALPAKKSGKKRHSEGTSADVNAKRVKKNETRKPRVWSVEDEITVLQGIIDFNADTGKSPFEEKEELYETLKGSISFEVSLYQFKEKIKGLNKKFMDRKKRKSFSKAHEQKLFELSKCIWGSDGLALKSVEEDRKSDGLALKSAVKSDSESHGSDWFEKSFVVGAIVDLGADKDDVKQRWSMVPMETKKILEEKWKVLQFKELEFVLQKIHFLSEVTSEIYR